MMVLAEKKQDLSDSEKKKQMFLSINTMMNGIEQECLVHPDQTALQLLHEQLNLTGTKKGCENGCTGACTILIDGKSIASCLLPAVHLEAKEVQTIESFKDPLHPIQRAFISKDALQCSYCTPGFLIESIAFYNKWKKQNKGQKPTRKQIAEVLSGHLCKQGTYEKIYDAVQAACLGEYEHQTPESLRYDAYERVTGQTKSLCTLKLPGMLYAQVLRSPYAHAKVTKLDYETATNLLGVKASLELLDTSRIIQHAGQGILALAAETEEQLREALKAVDVEYEILPATIGIEIAKQEHSEAVCRSKQEKKKLQKNFTPQTNWKHNLHGPFSQLLGKSKSAQKALKFAKNNSSHAFIESTWYTDAQSDIAIEPYTCIAHWKSSKEVTLKVSTQAVTQIAAQIAKRWSLKAKNVHVTSVGTGDYFNGKSDFSSEIFTAIQLSQKSNAPISLTLSRKEEMMLKGTRPATELQVALACNSEAKLSGVKLQAYTDSGLALGSNIGSFFKLMYPKAILDLKNWNVLTHSPPTNNSLYSSGPPAFWVLEQAVDQMAQKLQVDPLELRRDWSQRNLQNELYDWARELPVWKERAKSSEKGRYRRGIGLATAMWFNFADPTTQIELKATKEGIVATTSQSIGNNTKTIIAETIAQTFEIPKEKITVQISSPEAFTESILLESQTAVSIVLATKDAANKLLNQLIQFSLRHLQTTNPQRHFRGIRHDRGFIEWSEAFAKASPLQVIGKHKQNKGDFFFPNEAEGFAFGRQLPATIQITEVEVDTRLGKIRVLESWNGFSCGQIVSPTLTFSQIQGGVVQGISRTLYEQKRLDPKQGQLLTTGFNDYQIAGIGDSPKINIHFADKVLENVAGDNAGLQDLVSLTPAASIGNAIAHATGWRPKQLPIRPDRVLVGLKS